jgi:predicted O-linked N-acetylglucosamine transferase (SPINDLY family)
MSEALLQDALRLRRAGRLVEAAEVYAQVLRNNPNNFEALHALGLLCYQSGRLEDAEKLIGQAAAANPKAADAAYNHACLLQRLSRPEEALVSFDRALSVRPDYLEALVNRGGVLSALKRHEEALANADKVVALKPDFAEAWNNRGIVLQVLERFDDALQSYDRALALKPNYAEGWKNRAGLLTILGRHEEALQATDKALGLAPNAADLLCRRGDLLALLNRPEDAAAAYERYLGLKPDDADAWHARGFALKFVNRRKDALACFDKAVNLAPQNLAMRTSRGNMLFEIERFEDAARDYEILLAGESPPSWAHGYLTICRLHCCDWSSLDEKRAKISADLKEGRFVLDPIGNAYVSHSLAEQLQCARIWAADKYPAMPPLWRGERYRHQKIRLAYLSADFRAHATAFLMAGVFEHHDRNRFETIAISYSTDDRSPMRERLMRAFDRFIDVGTRNDAEIARAMREMEIDIAVDLKGYTAESRPGILSYRPAPVQAHYLGFPGTMGVDYVDYLIADPIVVPEEHRTFYTEKIAYLPDTYQCNDRERRVAERVPMRFEAGLPSGFVFCCFNNNHKIAPEMFAVWMRLLGQVEGSVLWLLQDNAAVTANLRREAKTRGIAPERLIFAPRTDPASHLARQSLADLFLDTLPYNAHTTASDALWVGLPLLTVPGSTFAGRVAASLLHAAGLPEMVTNSLADYEALALRLARDPAALRAIRAKLKQNRDSCPLFDTARITRNLENVYTAMWERSERGLPPATILAEGMRPP